MPPVTKLQKAADSIITGVTTSKETLSLPETADSTPVSAPATPKRKISNIADRAFSYPQPGINIHIFFVFH